MFGFPQTLNEQDMDGGGESEQAMLPSSLTLEYQGSKPKGSMHGFDMNSGLSVCEHLRGEQAHRDLKIYCWKKLRNVSLIVFFSNPPGYQTPSL